ncbi:MAG: hypothetical protein IJY23_00320 [Clostridia bacterium]|nr:hypothetical protein [Clostridia bacterium]
MKKFISLLIIISCALGLLSCGNKSDIPEGMQLVRGGEDVGYYFYAPEEWTVSNQGNISAAYASNVDTSSVTYVECDMPDVTVKEYFDSSLTEFPTLPTVVTDNKEITFGNADSAIMFEYEHEYSGHKFRTMQIFTKYGSRFGIFTFNSPLENISSTDVVQYNYYKEKIDKVIVNFKYVTKSVESAPETPKADSDGYVLVSDKKIAKFSLYLPAEFEVEYSSGMVSGKLPDGSNVNMTRATSTGVVVSDYWESRKEELSAIVTNLNVISENVPATLGDSSRAFAYEYTFVYNNTTYHVYQVLAVTTFNGFVFTYTAEDSNYNSHIETVKKIAEKVEF